MRLPNNWRPRPYQLPDWSYLERGGLRLYQVWHRRSGKDEIGLHWSAVGCHQRRGTYWYMLPEAAQARKAIWEAIDERTGVRRIDQAFPSELRAAAREQEMMLKLRCGSTWQVVGSDNYDSLVGAPPVGVVFSEWALAKPQAWGYLRPILANNGGWAVFNTTPRGKNHAYRMLQMASDEPGWRASVLTARDTGVFTSEQLETELRQLTAEHGGPEGSALYQQEYFVSFDAPVIGSIFSEDLQKAREGGRLTRVPYDSRFLVDTYWDIGYTDATAIWFVQRAGLEFHVIDYYENTKKSVDHYAGVLAQRGYTYGRHVGPADLEKHEFGSGKSIRKSASDAGISFTVLPQVGIIDSINSARQIFGRCYFDEERCAEGLDALANYRWPENTTSASALRIPVHDWASHGGSAWRYFGASAKEESALCKKHEKIAFTGSWRVA